ncbi:hypothetical protein KR093_002863 [Drosophila rubida]|uniref:Proline-rich protein PRCC n=1 Tax=Drosophila rubida TaxID=30044 RepID=A0AAD4JVQ2_9MUSC|nr:hypothetical protein KR093_002863 [Drosophila rubida]
MSLVAYATSSDEESDNEEEPAAAHGELIKTTIKPIVNNVEAKSNVSSGHISDEDDDYIPREVSLQELKPSSGRLTLALPKPKAAATPMVDDEQERDVQVTQAFAKLPMPRATAPGRAYIEETDDEFLHKKATGNETLEKPPPAAGKTRVKISIPSLRDFADVDKEMSTSKQHLKQAQAKSTKGCGLLSMLPQAKSERDFSKKQNETATKDSQIAKPTAVLAFVPDTVKQKRAAHNTESVDGVKATLLPSKQTEKKPPPKAALVSVSDSDDDEHDDGDFFSLHSEHKLPEVSSNEISAMVAKRAEQMVAASNKLRTEHTQREAAELEAAELQSEELRLAQQRYHEQHLNAEAMDALVGKNAKRRRKEAKDMQVIDISGTQVMPDRNEWMRTALASATTYQPTGVLTDEEPVAGTKRKHQITYLAHKAKANEAELQAMWSANRQTRRATQSKYGF